MFDTIKKLLSDCATSANGDFDPARVVGYTIAFLSGLTFLGLTIYSTVTGVKFDSSGFAVGLAGVSALIGATAGGVLLKNPTEIPVVPPVVPTQPMPLVMPPPIAPQPGAMPYPQPPAA